MFVDFCWSRVVIINQLHTTVNQSAHSALRWGVTNLWTVRWKILLILIITYVWLHKSGSLKGLNWDLAWYFYAIFLQGTLCFFYNEYIGWDSSLNKWKYSSFIFLIIWFVCDSRKHMSTVSEWFMKFCISFTWSNNQFRSQ